MLEKLLIANSKQTVILADYSKKCTKLGTFCVPIEVLPLAYHCVLQRLVALNAKPSLRLATSKAGPVVTDSGNFIIDADFGLIENPAELHLNLIQIVGVVETGLFCAMADHVYFAMHDGSIAHYSNQSA